MRQHAANHFRFRLGPEVEIALGAEVLAGGDLPAGVGESVELIPCRDRHGLIEPYDRLLSDAMNGDPLLFARQDEVETAWSIVDSLLREPSPVNPYAQGTWGPAEADRMVAAIGGWSAPQVSPRDRG
jgi:glucose-6-phosphate 1-dehydrogenase